MRVPDGAEAYKCVAGSLSDSYIFGFDVSFYKTYGTVCFRCYAVNMGALPLDMSTSKYLAQKQPPGHDHAVCMTNLKFS